MVRHTTKINNQVGNIHNVISRLRTIAMKVNYVAPNSELVNDLLRETDSIEYYVDEITSVCFKMLKSPEEELKNDQTANPA